METIDSRSLAEKSVDLEISQLQIELTEYRKELAAEGCDRETIMTEEVSFLEDRVAHLYRELYEIGEG